MTPACLAVYLTAVAAFAQNGRRMGVGASSRFVSCVPVWMALAILAAGCGGETPTPTSPAPAPSTPLHVSVAPNPLQATAINRNGAVTFRVSADVTFSLPSSTGVVIDRIVSTIAFSQTFENTTLSMSLSIPSSASIQVAPFGTATYSHVAEFGVEPGNAVTWHIEVSGLDTQGRPFTASSPGIPVAFP